MGSASRPKPIRLGEKLLYIRTALGLSQTEMLARLGQAEELFRSSISAYERGVREPPLSVLLKYARVAGVYVDALIDDDLDLPRVLPSRVKIEGIRRTSNSSTARVNSREGR